ncbi:Zn-dependent hydrolase [Effusibacillus consociatus]|uniref:Zn-dependent hydrolase n=1 Tax=Effusibacillus consociatus TaxID=1117041 RepID=A0ABV9PWU1_9BACL
MKTAKLKINSQRLQVQLEELGSIGRNERGGIDRTTFTPAEIEARNWLKKELNALGLSVRVDPAANIWAKREGTDSSLPVIAFGSHIDAVPNGGMYDGALGVLISLEIMRVLEENGAKTRHPLELVSFSAEEPNPFNVSTLGSRAVAGRLTQAQILNIYDPNGVSLADALAKAGGDAQKFDSAKRHSEEFAAFLEVHIEQGKRLIERNIPVGVVTAITGIYREEITVRGEANHAGTTRMSDRYDALTAASELILALEDICLHHPSDEVVGTVGKMTLLPNAANIIPEKVTFTLEVRGKTQEEIKEVMVLWQRRMEEVQTKRGIQVQRRVILDQPPEAMDPLLMKTCQDAAESLGYTTCLLGSMAGHDATHMSALTPTCMLFVPSIHGKSHCPEEESRMKDIEKVANVLLHTILRLDQTLNQAEGAGR